MSVLGDHIAQRDSDSRVQTDAPQSLKPPKTTAKWPRVCLATQMSSAGEHVCSRNQSLGLG